MSLCSLYYGICYLRRLGSRRTRMEPLTVVPSAPEGFGSLLQYALATYYLALWDRRRYAHTPFSFDHHEQEGKDPVEWNRELNDALVQRFVPNCLLEAEGALAMRPEKWPLELALRRLHEVAQLAEFYHARSPAPSFDLSRVNVAIHARTFNSTDCDTSDFREYVEPGSGERPIPARNDRAVARSVAHGAISRVRQETGPSRALCWPGQRDTSLRRFGAGRPERHDHGRPAHHEQEFVQRCGQLL